MKGEEIERGEGVGKGKPFPLLLRVIFSPRGGWKAVKRSGLSCDSFNSNCFYPLLAIASAGAFLNMLYDSNVAVGECLIDALIVFLSFFVSQFLVLPLLKVSLPEEDRGICDKRISKVMVSLSLSMLTLFYIIYELLPMLEPIMFFTPLIMVYAVSQGVRRMRAPDSLNMRIIVVLSVLLIGLPYLLSIVFEPVFKGALG